MATKTTHTHRGTCQACGAQQAVDNNTRLMAKHGYKVAGFGFFAGICPGSGRSGKKDARGYAIYIDVPMFGCSDLMVDDQQKREAYGHESAARQQRGHAESLLKHVIPRFGRPLYVAKHKVVRHFSVGQVVTVNGNQFKLVAELGSGRVTGYRVARIEAGIETETRGYMSLVQLRKDAE